MKRIAIAVCAVILASAVIAWTQMSAQPTSGSVEQELIKLEQGWANANVKADVAFLDRILAEDYTWTDENGVLRTKAQNLEVFKSREAVITSMVSDDMKVRVYGDAAVVTGRNTIKGTWQGKDIDQQERWTDTWIKRNGRWQCVATHSSLLAQK